MGSGFGLPIGLTVSLVTSKVAAGGASDTGRGPALLLSISSPITCPRFNFLRPLCSQDEAQSEERTRQGARPLPPLLQLAMMGIAARPWLPASVPTPTPTPPSPVPTAQPPPQPWAPPFMPLPLGCLTGAPAGDSVPNRSACCTMGKGGTDCGQGSREPGQGRSGHRLCRIP